MNNKLEELCVPGKNQQDQTLHQHAREIGHTYGFEALMHAASYEWERLNKSQGKEGNARTIGPTPNEILELENK